MNPKILASEAADILNISLQGVHKQLKTKKLEYSKLRNRIYFGHTASIEMFKSFKSSCKTMVFLLVKGGVGKSTLCRETAIRSTLLGKKVLIIELDHQGNLTKSFNIDASKYPVLIDLLENPELDIKKSIANAAPGLDIITSRYDNSVLDNFIMLKGIPLYKILKNKILKLKKDYDVIYIDCPPSLGQVVTAAVLCADLLILPTTPCDFSDSGIDITVREITKITSNYDIDTIPIKIVLNQFDNRERDSRDTYIRLIKDQTYGKMMLDCYIRKCKDIEKYRRVNSTIFETTTSNYGREDLDIFSREILGVNSPANNLDIDHA